MRKQEVLETILSVVFMVIGSVFFTLSSSFSKLHGSYKPWKTTLFIVLNIFALLLIRFAKYILPLQQLRMPCLARTWQKLPNWLTSLRNQRFRPIISFLVVIFTGFLSYYSEGKADVFSIISYTAYAATSLFLSSLVWVVFEEVMLSFIGLAIGQAMKMNILLGSLIGIVVGACFVLYHFYANGRTETEHHGIQDRLLHQEEGGIEVQSLSRIEQDYVIINASTTTASNVDEGDGHNSSLLSARPPKETVIHGDSSPAIAVLGMEENENDDSTGSLEETSPFNAIVDMEEKDNDDSAGLSRRPRSGLSSCRAMSNIASLPFNADVALEVDEEDCSQEASLPFNAHVDADEEEVLLNASSRGAAIQEASFPFNPYVDEEENAEEDADEEEVPLFYAASRDAAVQGASFPFNSYVDVEEDEEDALLDFTTGGDEIQDLSYVPSQYLVDPQFLEECFMEEKAWGNPYSPNFPEFYSHMFGVEACS